MSWDLEGGEWGGDKGASARDPHPAAPQAPNSPVWTADPAPTPCPSQPAPPTPPGLPSTAPLLTLISARLTADPSETEFAFPSLGSFLLAKQKGSPCALTPNLPARGGPLWEMSCPTGPPRPHALLGGPGREAGRRRSQSHLGADPPSPAAHVGHSYQVPESSQIFVACVEGTAWPPPWLVCDTEVTWLSRTAGLEPAP